MRELDSGNTKSFKKDAGKPRHELLPTGALNGAAKVFTFGAEKYDPKLSDGSTDDRTYRNNWRDGGMRWGRVYGALKRHLNAFWESEDYDPETGEHHLSHALCNLMMLHEYATNRQYLRHDDRNHSWRQPPRIALDVDGVINGVYQLIEDAIDVTMNHYSFYGDRIETLKNMSSEDMAKAEPLCDGKRLPFEPVAYVTARPPEWAEHLPEWLEQHGFPPARIVTTDFASKVAALRELEVDVFVEDLFENFVEINNAGILCYLIDRPYNQKWDVGDYRIHSLSEVCDKHYRRAQEA